MNGRLLLRQVRSALQKRSSLLTSVGWCFSLTPSGSIVLPQSGKDFTPQHLKGRRINRVVRHAEQGRRNVDPNEADQRLERVSNKPGSLSSLDMPSPTRQKPGPYHRVRYRRKLTR